MTLLQEVFSILFLSDTVRLSLHYNPNSIYLCLIRRDKSTAIIPQLDHENPLTRSYLTYSKILAKGFVLRSFILISPSCCLIRLLILFSHKATLIKFSVFYFSLLLLSSSSFLYFPSYFFLQISGCEKFFRSFS